MYMRRERTTTGMVETGCEGYIKQIRKRKKTRKHNEPKQGKDHPQADYEKKKEKKIRGYRVNKHMRK